MTDTSQTVVDERSMLQEAQQRAEISLRRFRTERVSVRSLATFLAIALTALTALWSLISIPRGQQLDSLKERQKSSLILTQAANANSPAAAASKKNEAGADSHLDLILAAISISLVVLGIAVRAWTIDVYDEIVKEHRDERRRATWAVWLRRLVLWPVQKRKEHVSRKLDALPTRVGNEMNVQVNVFEQSRGQRASARPLSEGVWESVSDREQYAKKWTPKVYDPRIPDEREIGALIDRLRRQAREEDQEEPILVSMNALIDSYMAETGSDRVSVKADRPKPERGARRRPSDARGTSTRKRGS